MPGRTPPDASGDVRHACGGAVARRRPARDLPIVWEICLGRTSQLRPGEREETPGR